MKNNKAFTRWFILIGVATFMTSIFLTLVALGQNPRKEKDKSPDVTDSGSDTFSDSPTPTTELPPAPKPPKKPKHDKGDGGIVVLLNGGTVDLAVTGMVVNPPGTGQSGVPNAPATLTVTIKNNHTQTDAGAFQVDVWWNISSTGSFGGSPNGTVTIAGLAANTSTTTVFSLPSLPSTPDNWKAKSIADSTTLTTDSNRNNNWKIITYSVVIAGTVTPATVLIAPEGSVQLVLKGKPFGSNIKWPLDCPTFTMTQSGTLALGNVGSVVSSTSDIATFTFTHVGTNTGIVTLTFFCGGASVTATIEIGRVHLTNFSRGGDKVVSAKDDTLGLPGGSKTIDVSVFPTNVTATLTIRRVAGTTGSAIFQDSLANITTFTSTGASSTKTITILGRDISSDARNMVVEAQIGNTVRNTFTFTVFRIDPEAFVTGTIDAVMPASVEHAGKLSDVYKTSTTADGTLGHNHVDQSLAYGGIVIRGKVVPSGMVVGDFN